jgi:Predicted secreted protein
MIIFSNILIFILIWWILFFILLPLKIRVPQKVESGNAKSAPNKAYLLIKFILTSFLSGIILFFLILSGFDLSNIFNK